ncbi:putative amino-acid permease [Exophiala viscosa]|uniref:putative amino-acid permease n=1 Tax=Exophiala viscosa TaxID=2486360 RepID=UPI002191A1EE|nr:putative amino-acid permease [Exophiala viscosa]
MSAVTEKPSIGGAAEKNNPASVSPATSDREHGQIVDADEDLLGQIGYAQEFRREFTRFSTLSYAISIMGVLGSVSATWSTPLAAGGPATAVWCWFSGSFFSLCIALSIAELVSAFPTSGGMYFVTKHVFPEEIVPVAAWVIGWSNLLGQTAGAASVGYSVGQMFLAMIAMGTVKEDGSLGYTPTSQHIVAASIVVLIITGVVCSFSTKILNNSIRWFAPVNIAASIAITIALLVLTPNKLPASDVFSNVTDGSGWNSKGFSFFLGYLSVAWTMTDYDATAHLSEELHNAAISGPVAIFQAVLVTWVFGVMLNIAFGFCAGDVAATLSSSLGNPAAQVFLNAAGKKAGIAMWFWVVLIQFFTGITAMLADTRTFFALSRDNMFPFSSTFRKMNKTTQTPLYSVWAIVALCCLLNLIALGSTQTINGIFGVTAPAMDCSYVAVIAARMYYAKSHPIKPGPFRLGRLQKPINIIAIAWVCFISVVLFFPPVSPVTATNMNYAVAIAGFIVIFALSWWYMSAKKYASSS